LAEPPEGGQAGMVKFLAACCEKESPELPRALSPSPKASAAGESYSAEALLWVLKPFYFN